MRLRWLARGTLFGTVLLALAGAALMELSHGKGGGGTALVGIPLGLLGGLIVLRAGNPIGWFFLVAGLANSISGFTDAYISYSLLVRPEALPGTSVAGWLNSLAFPLMWTSLPLVFLVFPTGHVPSPRWRPVLWLVGTSLALETVGLALRPGDVYGTPSDQGRIDIANPMGIQGAKPLLDAMITAAAVALVAAAGLSLVALVVRFRRSRGEERQQMKWLVYLGAVLAVLFSALVLIHYIGGRDKPHLWQTIEDISWITFGVTLVMGIPGAVALAVLKYRLYDIDLVINKTLVYGSLAAFITAVYVGVVVGIGSAFGRGDEPNLGLSILATAVVAVAFQPARQRVQRLANRLVYGKRAAPYEVLSRLASGMAEMVAADELLPTMARILAEGTGAARAEVWLAREGMLHRAAAWSDRPPGEASPAPASDGSGVPGATHTVPVRHQGTVLGALGLFKAPGDPLRPAEATLVADLASQAGIVLRNFSLIEDLRASRARLVATRDQERRKLERDIHDGAQQRLVALAVRLRLTQDLLLPDQQPDGALLVGLVDQTNGALDNLRELARGIYPPLLADRGLVAALEAQARKAPVKVEVMARGVGRYGQETEAAVYFCCLEAVQNVAKYSRATRCLIRLVEENGRLTFSVEDDGTGFDPDATPRGSGLTNMADRMAVLGGEIEVRSRPGEGTIVTGRLPVRELEPVSE